MTEPKQTTRNGSAPPEVARSTRQAAIDRMIARKLQATIDPENIRHLGDQVEARERAKRILEALHHAR
jgi:hypothetical protein